MKNLIDFSFEFVFLYPIFDRVFVLKIGYNECGDNGEKNNCYFFGNYFMWMFF